ncbi:MAG: SIS domain-containing protein [Nitrososphaeria archaeon]
MKTAEDMLEVYESWPDMFEPVSLGFEIAKSDVVYGCGYGSSLIPILVASMIYGRDRIIALRPGEMPGEAHRGRTLVVVSHSGETVEALECVKKGASLGMSVYAVTGGGALEDLCKREGVKHVKIKKADTTRLGFPYILSGLLPLLDSILEESATERVRRYFSDLRGRIERIGNEARSLAEFSRDSFLVGVYYTNYAEPLALRLRYLLSENAKLHSVYENIMEVAHDGITAWEMYYNMPVLIVRSESEDEITTERIRAISEALQGLGHRVREISIGGEEDLIHRLYMLDVYTVFLSILRNVNPFAMRTQEAIRRRVSLSHE